MTITELQMKTYLCMRDFRRSEIGGIFDVAHGAGLAAIWPSWACYISHGAPHRFVKFAVNAMGVEPRNNDGRWFLW